MACSKLDKGKCKNTRKICNKTYKVKMINFKTCPNFKKSPIKSKVKSKVKSKSKMKSKSPAKKIKKKKK
jgi:hypothetical protein